jgi:hypothetical protein
MMMMMMMMSDDDVLLRGADSDTSHLAISGLVDVSI